MSVDDEDRGGPVASVPGNIIPRTTDLDIVTYGQHSCMGDDRVDIESGEGKYVKVADPVVFVNRRGVAGILPRNLEV